MPECCCSLSDFLKVGSHVSQAVLELLISFICFPNAGIMSVCYLPWFYVALRIDLGFVHARLALSSYLPKLADARDPRLCSLHPPPLSTRVTVMCCQPMLFTGILGIWTWVLMFLQQALYPLSHLLVPRREDWNQDQKAKTIMRFLGSFPHIKGPAICLLCTSLLVPALIAYHISVCCFGFFSFWDSLVM